MAFRHRKFSGSFYKPVGAVLSDETVVTDELQNGRHTRRAYRKQVDKSITNSLLPTEEEYTLENLLSAGVPLVQVPTKIMNPTERCTLDGIKETIGTELYNQFLDEEWQSSVEAPQEVTENNTEE